MKLDLLLFGRSSRARSSRCWSKLPEPDPARIRRAMKILYSAIDQTSRHQRRIGPRRGGGGRARGARARGDGARHRRAPGPAPIAACAGCRCRRRSDRRICGWRAPGAIARLARGDPARRDHRAVPQLRRRGDPTARAGSAPIAVLEVNAPVVDHPGSSKALLDRALLVEPMRRWREQLCALADIIVTPNAAILPPGIAARADPRARVGRRHRTLPARR